MVCVCVIFRLKIFVLVHPFFYYYYFTLGTFIFMLVVNWKTFLGIKVCYSGRG